MSGARELLLALLLARVVGGGPGTALGATAELTAGGPHKAVRRNEAAAPYRASAVRVVRAGAQISAGDPLPFLHRRAPRAAPSPLPAARGLPARGRPPGVCSLCRPGAGSSSRLASSRSVNQVCVEKSLIFRSNTPYRTNTIAVSGGPDLFCVQLDDPTSNYFQQPKRIKESDFPKLLRKYGGHSFLALSQVQPSFSAFYRVGDPILIYFDSLSILSVLRQPVKMGVSGLCVDGNPAGFLESKSTSCTRTFTNLSRSCVTDPALDAASYYRDFAVLKVIYEIEFNGTHGIQSVSVRFKVTSISGNSGFSLQQHFTLHFWTRTLSHQLPRSGNPGYITGAPLLIANTSAVQHMSILQSESDGSCSQFLRHTVRFGSNMRTGCKLRLTQMEESNCSYVQLKLYKAFQGMNQAEDLAIIGSAHSTQVEERMTILIQNCSVQTKNCSSCCMVPVTLDIQILWAKMGLLSNPQAQILGVRYFYQCHPLKFLRTSLVPLTTVVTFTDMTEWPEPPRGLPKTHWKLPFDFFFPFKAVLNVERSYRDDLTACFVVILILSSILCF
ncbi:tectonic-3 isoform X3 [Numida meleagris]|uniref:tectonic-3 isoform X3 n=1 Tax=Numida meleagris TaxID=8996 RepID=UPI000B3DBD7F|nr:tectonic-3 isoform X3 [Numida meleagris]